MTRLRRGHGGEIGEPVRVWQCVQCMKPDVGNAWRRGMCCIGGTVYACSRACAETWCTANGVDVDVIEEDQG